MSAQRQENLFLLLALLLFNKSRFRELEIEHIAQLNVDAGNYSADINIARERTRLDFEDGNNRIDTLRQAIVSSLLWCFSALILSFIVAVIFKFQSVNFFKPSVIFGISSTFLILWATYAQLGWEIQTIEGNTYVERVNRFFFRVTFGVGMFLLFLAILTG